MSARDVVVISVLMFVTAIIVFIVASVGSLTIQKMIVTPAFNQSQTAKQVLLDTQTAIYRYDYLIFGVFIGLSLSLIITGWFVGGNPLFSFIYILLVMFGVALSTVLANVWETATANPNFGTTLSTFPIANYLMLHLPMFTAIVGFIGLVVMFAKPRLTGQQ